jgi:arylsulfatase A-like enzyme
MRAKPKLMQFWISVLVLPLVITAGFVKTSFAAQFDAPYYELKKKHGAEWAEEDKVINEKLAALEKKFGKKPNIIYILSDDIGWGELGWQGGGKHRGTPTSELDKMAYEGMRFYAAYSEPSCTPSRVAINTGRHPVRTGLTSVLWPGAEEGLAAEEKTVAEVLSEAGYDTAMWGKWHLGEESEHLPENQGYDYAYYGVWNGMIDAWEASAAFYENNMPQNVEGNSPDYPGREAYLEETGIDVSIAAYVSEKGKGRKPVEGAPGIPGAGRQEAFEKESINQITAYVKDKANSDKPFFIYWATYTQQISGSNEYKNAPYVDKANAHASFMAMHNDHVRQLLDTLRDSGIDENTLVVWWSDNGPMYAFYPTAGFSFLKGAKGDVTEGGVKVPAMAWWPGMIEPNQDPVDFIHLTDLYTTAARLGGAMDKIPSDRVVDGLDQTSLLLLGEGHSRRDYMFHYSGENLGAVRWKDIKAVLTGPSQGGLPGLSMYNVKRDPIEREGALYSYLWTVTPFQNIVKGHKRLIEKYPHRVSKTMPKGAELTAHD